MRLARALLLASLFATLSGVPRGAAPAGEAPALQAAPGAPELTAPPDGSRLPDFRADLAWTNPPGTAQYHLEVVPFNNDGPGITLVRNVESSFSVEPPRMGSGNYVLLPDMTYTWRVAASDNQSFAPPGDASYGPAAQRTFKTPAVTSGGIGPVAPSDGGAVDSLTPTLQWQDGDNRVFYYEIQISKDPGFGAGDFLYWELVHGGVSSPANSYRVPDAFPLEPNTRYHWRVRPRVQGDGQPVGWSRSFSFGTPGGELRVRLERAFPNLTIPRLTNLVQPNDASGRFFTTEQRGIVRVFTTGQAPSAVFLDISSKVLTENTEEGLLGIAFDPDYRENGHFYLYYSARNPRRNVVSRFSVRGDDPGRADPASEAVLLELIKPFGNHNGGQLAFGPDGYLYLGPGDGGGGGDPFRNGQNLGALLGKILRIDVRGAPPEGYRIPPDNPFLGVAGARAEVWAYGMRNPWRFSFDAVTGRLWAGDVGQNAFEEIDIVEKGKNYGWNVMEGSHCYSPSSGCTISGLELPVADYGRDKGCSVTGGFVYRGNAIPALRGAYVYADFCSGTVWGLWHDGSSVLRHEVLLEAGDEINISSFAEDLNRELYALSWNRGIYRLVPG